ncbi:MAG: hypothetical protein QXT19_04620 [Candidatus Woesearchaeota archaeon]
MPNIELLIRIQKCKLWSGLIKPLEGINLEGVEYITPEMKKELGYREEFAKQSWKKVQEELKATGALEEQVLEWAQKTNEFAQKEHYFVKDADVVKKQHQYPLHHTGDTYCYISPILAKSAFEEISKFQPTAVLRTDKEFLTNLEILAKEYKPEYYQGRKELTMPVFNEKNIRKMLADDALVQADELRKNTAQIVKDLKYYKAAHERRKMFEAEVTKRAGRKNIEYALHEKHAVADEWYDQFIQIVHEQIKNDEVICRLVNGQSAGKFWTGWTKSLRFSPRITDAYQHTTLSIDTLKRWVDSHYASTSIKFALQGLDAKISLLQRIGRRLEEQYTNKHNNGFITEHDFFDVYPQAAKRLMNAFDEKLLNFSPKTTT